jgi:rubredoxin
MEIENEVEKLGSMPVEEWRPIAKTDGGLWAYLFDEGSVQIAFQPSEDDEEPTDVGVYIASEELPSLRNFLSVSGNDQSLAWQSMESAPLDGQRILILSECGIHEGQFDRTWFSRRGDSVFGIYGPTLWMPLPSIPPGHVQVPPPWDDPKTSHCPECGASASMAHYSSNGWICSHCSHIFEPSASAHLTTADPS